VATTNASQYIKSNKKRGRKSLAEKAAINNTKIDVDQRIVLKDMVEANAAEAALAGQLNI
jgi:hypothetical protein